VILGVVGGGEPGVDVLLAAPGDPRRELTAVTAHGIGPGIAVGDVRARETSEGGV
jgi:hypothetical protein